MTKTGGTYPVDEGKANSRQILHQVHENKHRLQRASAPMSTTEESQQTQLQADTASHIRKKAQAGKSISNHVNKQRIQQLSLLLIDLSCIEKSFYFPFPLHTIQKHVNAVVMDFRMICLV
jgi:hypothetical protein